MRKFVLHKHKWLVGEAVCQVIIIQDFPKYACSGHLLMVSIIITLQLYVFTITVRLLLFHVPF